ncbi:MAG: hypothetical protein WDN67_05190 [Candidatus Moraniibacteriota bacterium]
MENDLYVTILEFGKSRLSDGFTVYDLLHHLDDKGLGFNMDDSKENMRFFLILHNLFFEGHDNRRLKTLEECNDQTFFIRPEAYFQYIDYLELKEALRSSKEAKEISLRAIIISAFLAFASICFQITQIYRPMEILPSQIQEIIEAIDTERE